MYNRSVFIFRRDLRLEDNTGLIKALAASKEVAPVFIFDPISLNNNQYRGDNSVQFMLECLSDLDGALRDAGGKLFIFQGRPAEVLVRIASENKIDGVFLNFDYTPYSIERDSALREAATRHGLKFHGFNDLTLQKPESWRKANGQPYTIYTPFAKIIRRLPVPKSTLNQAKNYSKSINGTVSLAKVASEVLKADNPRIYVRGGREQALRILKGIDRFRNYNEVRNFPAIEGTTGLAAHHKFGSVSIREVYHSVAEKLGQDSLLINELYWREFFTMIGATFPHIYKGCFHKRFDDIKWEDDPHKFEAWCSGLTGFPIVDAGMRQLNETGFMHNRVRMIVASFLIKNLHINWRRGEMYFAQKLVDYDPAVNNGNWQWAASTGCDAQPWFRIFNPWLQQKKFDPEAVYIKRWVPELVGQSAKAIHGHFESVLEGYLSPIVSHAKEREVTQALYGNIARR